MFYKVKRSSLSQDRSYLEVEKRKNTEGQTETLDQNTLVLYLYLSTDSDLTLRGAVSRLFPPLPVYPVESETLLGGESAETGVE